MDRETWDKAAPEYGNLVEIYWIDSVADHGWSYREEARDKAVARAMDCISVGWVLKVDDEFVVTYSADQQHHSVFATMQIPRVAVKDIKILSKGVAHEV